jgi:hypothetical protein
MCVVYLDITGGSGVTASLTVTALPTQIDTERWAISQTLTATSDSNGRITFEEIPQGVRAQLKVASAGIDVEIEVPYNTSYKYRG